MNKTIKTILATALTAPLLTGCLEETFPSSTMTQEQVEQSESSLAPLSNALARQLMVKGNDNSSVGYPGIMMSLDVAAGQLPVASTSYDYLQWYANDTYLGETGLTIIDWWAMYTNIIHCANLVFKVAPEISQAGETERIFIGNALAYRAMAYLDMVRLYEYKHTGVASLDSRAEEDGIYKLTVPLITENTTEKEARNNPRQPFYVIYRFIMDDLNRAEECLQDTRQTNYTMADAAVIAGLKARLWLEMGSRFTLYPEDLTAQVAHEGDEALKDYDRLGVTTAAECFDKAATYARQAINDGGQPLSEAEWMDPSAGFNTANHAWLWAEQVKRDDISDYTWAYFSLTGMMAPEANFGVGNTQYGATRMIDAQLYGTIEQDDWRRRTWIDPADAGDENSAGKYSTLLNDAEWSMFGALAGFKYRPGSGDMNDYMNGVAVDMPLMRVEEMYLIEAEALGHAQGVSRGVLALEDFVRTYRNPSYTCSATTMDELTDEVLRQKKIEFWGEGIVAYDYKRLEKAVIKQYDGSNHPESYQSNTLEGYVAPRLNVCFPNSETLYNSAIKNNPDPGTK